MTTYLKFDKHCNGMLGSTEDGQRVVACSYCDRGCDGKMIAPNAAYVCSDFCLKQYEERRQLQWAVDRNVLVLRKERQAASAAKAKLALIAEFVKKHFVGPLDADMQVWLSDIDQVTTDYIKQIETDNTADVIEKVVRALKVRAKMFRGTQAEGPLTNAAESFEAWLRPPSEVKTLDDDKSDREN